MPTSTHSVSEATVVLLAALLKGGEDGFVSGEELARRLKVSRVSVWGHASKLRHDGLHVEAVRGRGYRLTAEPEALHPAMLAAHLRIRGGKRTTTRPRVIFLPQTDSTNLEAERRLAAGEKAPFVIFAARQSAGRGRLGRSWHSAEAGSLYLSFGFRPELPPSRMTKFTLWMALRLCAMLEKKHGLPVRVKWPNDIVHDGRKLAGILTEARVDADEMRELICGIGLNVNGDPARWSAHGGAIAAKVAGTLQQINHGRALPLNAVAADIILAGASAYTDFIRNRAESRFAEQWEHYDVLHGRDISVALHGSTLRGRVLGLDSDGALLIELPDGERRTVQSGDVTLGTHTLQK